MCWAGLVLQYAVSCFVLDDDTCESHCEGSERDGRVGEEDRGLDVVAGGVTCPRALHVVVLFHGNHVCRDDIRQYKRLDTKSRHEKVRKVEVVLYTSTREHRPSGEDM